MNPEHNPLLEKLFADAVRDLQDEEFVAGVMVRLHKQRRRELVFLLAASLVAAPALWLVASPLNDSLPLVMEFVSRPLAETDNVLAASILSPLNSVATLLALGLLALRTVYRRLFA